MKLVKTKGEPMAVLYREMCDRVRDADLRLQSVAAMGNKAAMLAEARALQGLCGALADLLDERLRAAGKRS